MSKINHITIVLSFTKLDANGKQTEFKRRFDNINPDASNDQIKTFSKLIERLTGETAISNSSNLYQFNQEDIFMTKTLELSFKSSLDKPVKLQLPQLNNVVTEQVARDSMNALVDLNIIKSNSGTITKVHSAQIIDKTTTVLFEDKK
ncbi:Protein of uncharacterised function (DUF2922) [Staphylococcus aureus]|nr:Protein of uncharacterised function (DUF2922) [Staphylococcus aureus]